MMGLKIRPQDRSAEQRTLEEMGRALGAGYMGLRTTLAMVQRLIFTNPYGMTPQEVATLLGTDAANLFAVAEAATQLLSLTGDTVTATPKGWSVTTRQDGTVAVTEG